MKLLRVLILSGCALPIGAICSLSAATAPTGLIVTELLSNEDSSGTEDYWELTNAGASAVDLSNWSWDDNSATPGVVPIPSGTMIAPGESILFTAMDAAGFRTWWGLDAGVQVITGAGAPGLGGGDGVYLFDDSDALVVSFDYDGGNFTLADGNPSLGGHAGLSAGGSVAWQAVVIDPAYGVETPRYTFADGATLGTFASTLSTGEFGSPGFAGLTSAASHLMLTEILSNESALAPTGAEDYWELTNFGDSTADISGYSWHDSGRSAAAAAAWALPPGSTIGAGESVIFTEADPAVFRAWWGLPESVQVFQSVGAPGLGKNDGVAFFDAGGNELFYFSYAADGFTQEDGSPSLGNHAGPSGGAAEDWDALIWVPGSGTQSPRYTGATSSNHASFQAVAPATDLGSPGSQGIVVATVSIADATIWEGNGGTSVLSFVVTRSNPDTAFTVDYTIEDGTAVLGEDYAAFGSGSIAFSAGGPASVNIDLIVNGDLVAEPDETLTVTLSNLSNTTGTTTIANAVATGTIRNDDPIPPTLLAGPMDTSVAAGGVATLTVAADGFPTPTLQWYEGNSGDTSQPVTGATSASFTTPALTATTAYWARATNSAGAVDSATATVTVIPAATSIDLSTYVRIGRYDLPEPTRTALPASTPTHNLLCQEASGVAYNWDTDTLFVVGDGGRSVTQVSKTGELVDTMTLALGSSPQGTEFYDPEGITYLGGGEFVFTEERDRQLVKFTYVAGTTLTRDDTLTVKLGTYVDNTGTEGLSFDPLTGGFICLKEVSPIGIFQTGVDFVAGTATNGSAATENSVDLFDPALLGLSDVADVFALSNLPGLSGQPQEGNLLVLSQEDARIVNIDRSGNIHSTLQIVSDLGNPLSVANQQHEGLTMDAAGNLYVVSENGGGGIDYPQLWVYAPSSAPNAAPTAVVLNNAVTSIEENTSTASPIKVGEIVVVDDGLGANDLALSGADAASFEIVGTELYLRAGTVLDYESQAHYAITIEVDDTTLGSSPDASVAFTLDLLDLEPEVAPPAAVIISEIAPWSSGNSAVGEDWFELTNTSDNPIDLTGWKVDDGSASFASAAALNGITTIEPGESVIFIETNDLATLAGTFLSHWFGANPPIELQVGSYTGSGLGLSSNGDGVNVYNAAGVLQTSVTFGPSPSAAPFTTFDNTPGLNGGEVTAFSADGVRGAFVAAGSADEIGSPGYAAPGFLAITEVAPWSSGNSPVGADWFEVTNLGARPVDLSGWKFDDGSESPAAAVALIGVNAIAPGESVVFIEYDTTLADARTAFIANWFGGHPPTGLQIGGYTGSGVGLSTGGDAVNLYDSHTPTPVRRANVAFGSSPSSAPFATFDNTAGLDLVTLTQLSVVGTNGAFVAVHSPDEIGSPGSIDTVPLVAEFAAWLATNGYTSVDLYGDTDHNGIADLVEYFFDQDPGDALDTGNLPRLVKNGADLELRFVFNNSAPLDAYLFLSTDLSAWSPAGLGIDYDVIEAVPTGSQTAVRYRLLGTPNPGIFLKIELQPGAMMP